MNSALKTEAATARGGSRNEFIQAMRFVAAALVLLTHATFYYHERISPSWSTWHFGEIGVPIFFVISGIVMVISSVTLASNAAGAKEFMARRLLRILPLYWLVTLAKVVIALAIPVVVNHNHFDLVHAIKSFLFIPAYNAAGEIRPIHGVGWTLLHEMFFYVVFAAMMFLKANPARFASLIILALYGLGLALPPETAFMTVATSPLNLYFIVGMLVGSASVASGSKFPWRTALVGACLLVAAAKYLAPELVKVIPLDPLVLVLACAMLALATWKMPALFHVPVSLGESSYALYLFHPLLAPPILMLVHKFASGLGAVAEIALTAVITIGLGHGIHLLVELSLNRWFKQRFRRRAPVVQPIGEAA